MFQKMPENILLSDSSLFSLSRDDEDVYLTVNSKASLTVKRISATTISGYELNIGTGSSHIQGDLGVNRLLPVDNTSSIGGDGDEYEYGYFNNLTVSSLAVEDLTVTQNLNISGGIRTLTVQDEITTNELSVNDIQANGIINGELNTFNNDPHELPIGGLCFISFHHATIKYLERGEVLYLYEETSQGAYWSLTRESTEYTNITVGLCSIDGTTYDDPSSTQTVRPSYLQVGDRIQILSHGYNYINGGTIKRVPCLAIRLQRRVEE